MGNFFTDIGLPLEDMITAWEKRGIEEWAIREAAEEWYEEKGDTDCHDPITISWDILERAEGKRPVSQSENRHQSDPNLRTEINRLRGIIANFKEIISDLLSDKEKMWLKIEALQAQAKKTRSDFKELYNEIEVMRLEVELDKMETDAIDLKEDVKSKRRWWQRRKDE